MLFNFTRFAWMVPLTVPPIVNSSADDVAFHFCAFVYQNGQRPKLALDLAQYMHCALANNFADHSHAATDGGNLIG